MPTVNGMDSAAAALRYWERKQEVVANNLANATTSGFKAERVFARLLNGAMPVAHSSTDRSVGNISQTGQPFDLAMTGDGFFVVSTPNGDRYSRGGSLHLDAKRQLVNEDGHPLLIKKGDTVGPLVLADGPFTISKSGEVDQGGQILGQLVVETAPPGVGLQHEAGTLLIPPAERTVVPPADRTVAQGHLEDSNVNTVSTMVDMIAVQRSFASVQKAIVELDQVHETATQLGKPS
jgi:flagellar basal-body rod protein FlgF